MPRRQVTARELKRYVQTFLETLRETADRYLPEGQRGQLWHTSLLPAEIICYVSRTFGVAIEYRPSDATTVQGVWGSSRVEDLLFQTPRTVRAAAPAIAIHAADTGFIDVSFQGRVPFRLRARHANAWLANVTYEVGDHVRSIPYAEVFGDRRAETWSETAAVSRAKDEVLAAATELARAGQRETSIREYVRSHKKKTVLLLGSYSAEGQSRLERLAAELRRRGYDPLLVSEVPDHPLQDLPQKVTALGSIARFVVVDDSEPSGHLAEIEICKQNRWVTAVLRRGGEGASWMSAGASLYSTVLREGSYEPPPMSDAVDQTLDWAEEILGTLERELGNTFPWRRSIAGDQ